VWLVVFGSKKPFGSSRMERSIERIICGPWEAGSDVEVVFSSKAGFDEKKTFLESIKYLESEKAYIGDTPIGYSILKAHESSRGCQIPRSSSSVMERKPDLSWQKIF